MNQTTNLLQLQLKEEQSKFNLQNKSQLRSKVDAAKALLSFQFWIPLPLHYLSQIVPTKLANVYLYIAIHLFTQNCYSLYNLNPLWIATTPNVRFLYDTIWNPSFSMISQNSFCRGNFRMLSTRYSYESLSFAITSPILGMILKLYPS